MTDKAEYLLQVSGLGKRFGGFEAVSDLSFDLEAGQILGLVGPNGAGKTTTFNLISGFLSPTTGSIVFKGEDITGQEAEDALHEAGITANKNMVPYDPQPPMVTSGIRLGTPAVTTRGFRQPEMKLVADAILAVIFNAQDETKLKEVAQTTTDLCARFPVPGLD